jgi:hypothetical protein
MSSPQNATPKNATQKANFWEDLTNDHRLGSNGDPPPFYYSPKGTETLVIITGSDLNSKALGLDLWRLILIFFKLFL